MFRIAVLVSGRGSNLRALLEAARRGELAADVVGVFSDKPGCAAVALAREAGIATVALSPRDYPSRLAFDEALFNEVAAVQPDLIVCAGYMRIISDAIVQKFEDRMINLHPSLLPKFPGLDTHARALAAGESEHGASVHRVIPALDAGPVLAQARVPVHAGDTPQALAERVQAREHPLLLRCVQALAQGRTFPTPMRLNDHDQLEPVA
jgi:phosphoribosylglycinamide formyltransferase-1